MRYLSTVLAAILALAVTAWAQSPPLGIRPIFGMQVDSRATSPDGLVADVIVPDSVAARLGIESGDVLLSLNGQPMHTLQDLHQVMEAAAPHARLKARYRHDTVIREKEDSLRDPPTLPSYEIVEGKGIAGTVQIGDTRAQVEKALGKPLGELQREAQRFLAYPAHGITVALLPAGDVERVWLIRTQYPFVGKTSRGLLTVGSSQDIAHTYAAAEIDHQAHGDVTVDAVRRLGIRFSSSAGSIIEVVVLPPESKTSH